MGIKVCLERSTTHFLMIVLSFVEYLSCSVAVEDKFLFIDIATFIFKRQKSKRVHGLTLIPRCATLYRNFQSTGVKVNFWKYQGKR